MLAIPYEYANEVAFISDEVSLFPFTASNCNVYELRWATVGRSTLYRCLLTRIEAFDQVFDFELQTCECVCFSKASGCPQGKHPDFTSIFNNVCEELHMQWQYCIDQDMTILLHRMMNWKRIFLK
jgi:hypothetical protein